MLCELQVWQTLSTNEAFRHYPSAYRLRGPDRSSAGNPLATPPVQIGWQRLHNHSLLLVLDMRLLYSAASLTERGLPARPLSSAASATHPSTHLPQAFLSLSAPRSLVPPSTDGRIGSARRATRPISILLTLKMAQQTPVSANEDMPRPQKWMNMPPRLRLLVVAAELAHVRGPQQPQHRRLFARRLCRFVLHSR